MFKIFSELLLQGELTIDAGHIKVLKQRVVMLPADMLVELTKDFMNDPARVKHMYALSRDIMYQGFVSEVKRKYNLQGRALVGWLQNIGELAGLGTYEIVDYDPDLKRAIVKVYNLPVGVALKGKTNKPVDHIVRGFMAGIATAAFGVDVDYVETKCVSMGADYCEFVAKPREDFKKEKNQLVDEQLPL